MRNEGEREEGVRNEGEREEGVREGGKDKSWVEKFLVKNNNYCTSEKVISRSCYCIYISLK